MRHRKLIGLAVPLLLVIALGTSALANDQSSSFGARLRGYEEVPAINSAGAGQFAATVNSSGTVLTYNLSYSGLSSTAQVAHIHFAQRGVAGGVVAFLCGGGGKPACPSSGGTVSGTIVASDIQALSAQGIVAGDLASVLRAMRAGVTYVNVHSTNFSGGEIRGQISVQEQDQD